MKYAYFPGCSLKGTGRAYEESFLAVFRALGVEMAEIEDWNCCGATAYMAVDEARALALAARNLALAEKQQCGDLVAPCNGCYLILMKSEKWINESPETSRNIQRVMREAGLEYSGKVAVRHPLEILLNDIGLEAIKSKARRTLKGLRVAPYYGCQIVRPYATFDDQYRPMTMDRLLESLGAAVVDYRLKTRCCGGALTGTIPDVGQRMAYILLHEAKRCGADVMAVCCPLCHFNLDSYQKEIKAHYPGDAAIPAVYFTQLLGLALGLDAAALGLDRNIVPAKALWAELAPAAV